MGAGINARPSTVRTRHLGLHDSALIVISLDQAAPPCQRKLSISLANAPHIQTVELYQLESVGSPPVPDKMIPLALTSMTLTAPPRTMVLKIGTTDTIGRTNETVSITLSSANNSSSHKLDIAYLPYSASPQRQTIIQANLQPRGISIADEDYLRLVKYLVARGFSSFLFRPRDYHDAARLTALLTTLQSSRGRPIVKIPARKLYDRKHRPSFSAQGHSLTSWAKAECRHITKYYEKIRETGYAGDISYKIWDEPVESQYPLVRRMYDAVHDCLPGPVLLELSEHPADTLGSSVGVWVSHIDDMRQAGNERARPTAIQLVYANKLHSPTEPPYAMRNIGFLMWHFNADGYHFWSLIDYRNGASTGPYTRANAAWRGALLYVDEPGKIYPSFRLEQFLQGIEDMMLLNQMESQNSAVASHLTARLRKTISRSHAFSSLSLRLIQPRKKSRDSLGLGDLARELSSLVSTGYRELTLP